MRLHASNDPRESDHRDRRPMTPVSVQAGMGVSSFSLVGGFLLRWLLVTGLRTGVGGVPPQNNRDPSLDNGGAGGTHPRFHQPEDLPDEAGQFTGDGHGDFVALLATGE